MGLLAMPIDKPTQPAALIWDRPADHTGIRLTAATALAATPISKAIPPAKGDRRPLQERIEAAERAETLSVALGHPHRNGSDDPRLATPLGRFCAHQKLGDHCRQAGEQYREIVEDDKIARGFQVHGWAPSDRGYVGMTLAQIEARKELAIKRRREADAILRAVIPRLAWAMERLVYEEQEPSPYDRDIITHGLINLANEWELAPKKFGV